MLKDKLKTMEGGVRIGGKGTVRRKRKVVHRTATTDDKKLQGSLYRGEVFACWWNMGILSHLNISIHAYFLTLHT